MSLERIAISAFVWAYRRRGLDFPGITQVQDTMYDKLADLAPRISQWEPERQTAYYARTMRYTANRLATQEVHRRKLIERLKSEVENKQKKHFEDEVDSRLMCAAIIEEARKLPRKTQQMLGMAILGTPLSTIAKELQVPLATVKSRLGRARRIIKRRIQ